MNRQKESNGNGLKAKIYADIRLEGLRKITITSVSISYET
jgi:hypothetical protein